MKGNRYRTFGNIAKCYLSNGKAVLVSPESVPLLKKYTWCLAGNGYAMSRSCAPMVTMHRLLMDARPGEIVDHIDRNPLNNTLENLRICTRRENSANTTLRRDNSAGFKGVSFVKSSGRYRAYIFANGKQKHLGMFDTAAEAAARYAEAASALFGSYAPDFIKEGAPCHR